MNEFFETLAQSENQRQKLCVTSEKYRHAVNALVDIALTETSGGRAVAQVLLFAWNCYVWQLDIPDLCYLDYDVLEQVLVVIRGQVVLVKEAQEVIPEGNAVMKRIAAQWQHLNAERLIEACSLTPYSRTEFISAYRYGKNAVEQARRLVIRATMGFGSAGATKGTTGFRLDTKRASGTAQHIWSRMPDNLAAVGQRFEGVLVENQDAIQCMLDYDAADTLHFLNTDARKGISTPIVHHRNLIS